MKKLQNFEESKLDTTTLQKIMGGFYKGSLIVRGSYSLHTHDTTAGIGSGSWTDHEQCKDWKGSITGDGANIDIDLHFLNVRANPSGNDNYGSDTPPIEVLNLLDSYGGNPYPASRRISMQANEYYKL